MGASHDRAGNDGSERMTNKQIETDEFSAALKIIAGASAENFIEFAQLVRRHTNQNSHCPILGLYGAILERLEQS